MEAVFRAGIFSVPSGKIPVLPVGNGQKLPDNQRSSGPEYCFRFPSISGAFPSETVLFPELSGRFLSFPEDKTTVLGSSQWDIIEWLRRKDK
jgi:hypothetical protein